MPRYDGRPRNLWDVLSNTANYAADYLPQRRAMDIQQKQAQQQASHGRLMDMLGYGLNKARFGENMRQFDVQQGNIMDRFNRGHDLDVNRFEQQKAISEREQPTTYPSPNDIFGLMLSQNPDLAMQYARNKIASAAPKQSGSTANNQVKPPAGLFTTLGGEAIKGFRESRKHLKDSIDQWSPMIEPPYTQGTLDSMFNIGMAPYNQYLQQAGMQPIDSTATPNTADVDAEIMKLIQELYPSGQ